MSIINKHFHIYYFVWVHHPGFLLTCEKRKWTSGVCQVMSRKERGRELRSGLPIYALPHLPFGSQKGLCPSSCLPAWKSQAGASMDTVWGLSHTREIRSFRWTWTFTHLIWCLFVYLLVISVGFCKSLCLRRLEMKFRKAPDVKWDQWFAMNFFFIKLFFFIYWNVFFLYSVNSTWNTSTFAMLKQTYILGLNPICSGCIIFFIFLFF